MIECKVSDNTPHPGLSRFAGMFQGGVVQIVQNLRQEEFRHGIRIAEAVE